jgi:hypothetical protein
MERLHRLDSICPSLAIALRKADDQKRRKAISAACLVAVRRSGLHGDEVDAALELILHGRNDVADTRSKLDALVVQFDELYLQLKEEAGDELTAEAIAFFRKARAAAALSFALSPDSRQLHEAVYEAIIASDDQAEATQAAEMALKTL